MAQHYSDPKRASNPTALPDVETFELTFENTKNFGAEGEPPGPGWYWWSCFPGCLPDGEPTGPFDTEAEALADAQSVYDDGGDE